MAGQRLFNDELGRIISVHGMWVVFLMRRSRVRTGRAARRLVLPGIPLLISGRSPAPASGAPAGRVPSLTIHLAAYVFRRLQASRLPPRNCTPAALKEVQGCVYAGSISRWQGIPC